jgi:integrase
MGRPLKGPQPRQRTPGGTFSVRFTWAGKEHELSCGTTDPVLAAREAARLYADVVSREPRPDPRVSATSAATLERLVEQWLVSIVPTHDQLTVKTWKLYAESHFLPFFDALHHINDAMCRQYRDARLTVVLGVTVKKELSALRSFVKFLTQPDRNNVCHLDRQVVVEGLPKGVKGTRYEKRRRSAAFPVSPDERDAMLALLPEWSASKKVARFPIRARFIVASETSLRPETLDHLSVPEHWQPGQSYLWVTLEIDKNGWEREVPLTPEAQQALESVSPKRGLIFGKHDYRDQMKKAAAVALQPHRAKIFTGGHFRSICLTHSLEDSSNLMGAQHMAGHKRATTTARYAKPSARAAQELLADRAKKRAAQQPPAEAPPGRQAAG